MRDAKGESSPSGISVLTRRDLLQRAAWIVAASGIPSGSGLYAQEVSPVMTKLSAYMSEARGRVMPEKAMDETKHHILDTLAAMISGSELPPGRQALRFAGAYAGGRMATMGWGAKSCASTDGAVMALGDGVHGGAPATSLQQRKPTK